MINLKDAFVLAWDGAPGKLQELGPRFISRSFILEKILRKYKPYRTLEIGCGRGNITKILAKYSHDVLAIDQEETAINECKYILSEYNNVRLKKSDLFSFNCDGNFDLIVLSEVLEHIEDDNKALSYVNSLLTPNGLCLLTVPANPKLWNEEDITVGHKRRYTRQHIYKILEKNQFDILKCINWGFPINLIIYKYITIKSMYKIITNKNIYQQHNKKKNKGIPYLYILIKFYKALFRFISSVEILFSIFDKGIGYVCLAKKAKDKK